MKGFLPKALVLSLTVLGCAEEPAVPVSAVTTEEIVIGQFSPLTGANASFGESVDRGVRLAVGERNAAGGIKGKTVSLVVEDTESRPQNAAGAVSKMAAREEIIAIIGEVASARTLAGAPIAQSNAIPMITPASTNHRVTEVGNYIFRVSYLDQFQGRSLAGFVHEKLGLKRGAILRDVRDEYSTGLAGYFAERFAELGGQIIMEQTYVEGDEEFRPQLRAIAEVAPEFLFIPGYYRETALIARQARELGIESTLIGGDGWASPGLLETGGSALNGAYFANSFIAGDTREEAVRFVREYRKVYGERPDALAALGYDAANVLMDAIERAEELTRASVRAALENTTRFKGATGTITIGPDRNALKPLVILKIEEGELVLANRITAGGIILEPDQESAAEEPSAASP